MSDEAPQTALERYQAATEALAGLRVHTPEGTVTFNLPAEADMAACVDAVARLMVEKGLVTTDEFVDAKTLRLAELAEEMLEQAKQVKQRASGLVVPGARSSAVH